MFYAKQANQVVRSFRVPILQAVSADSAPRSAGAAERKWGESKSSSCSDCSGQASHRSSLPNPTFTQIQVFFSKAKKKQRSDVLQTNRRVCRRVQCRGSAFASRSSRVSPTLGSTLLRPISSSTSLPPSLPPSLYSPSLPKRPHCSGAGKRGGPVGRAERGGEGRGGGGGEAR